jgi:hypothetical protein
VRTIVSDALQLCNAVRHVRLEIAMATRLGNPAQPQNLGVGHAWTAPGEGFPPHLHPWGGLLILPIPQGGAVLFGDEDFDQR